MIAGCVLDRPPLLDAFAYRDGFEHWGALRTFWLRHHGELAPFQGFIIHWREMVPA